MAKKISSMQLEEFFLTHLDISWRRGNVSEEGLGGQPGIDYEIARNSDDQHIFRLALHVALTPPEDEGGLSVRCNILGFFSFPEETEEDDMQYLARVNGATMLYGILRGQVAMATGSFPSGKANLPPVVMQDILPQIDREKAAVEESHLAEDGGDYHGHSEDG